MRQPAHTDAVTSLAVIGVIDMLDMVYYVQI